MPNRSLFDSRGNGEPSRSHQSFLHISTIPFNTTCITEGRAGLRLRDQLGGNLVSIRKSSCQTSAGLVGKEKEGSCHPTNLSPATMLTFQGCLGLN